MAHLLMQVSAAGDGTFPRDRCVNTLHFDAGIPSVDHQSLTDDLATIYDGLIYASPKREITVKCYDLGDAEPRRPKATKTLNPAASPASSRPREVAVCLSFAGGARQPHQRGRIYLVYDWIITGSTIPVRPPDNVLSGGIAYANAFSGLGGVDIAWEVWSPTRQLGTHVNYAWVDDEWDTQRRRGLRPTKRTASAVSG